MLTLRRVCVSRAQLRKWASEAHLAGRALEIDGELKSSLKLLELVPPYISKAAAQREPAAYSEWVAFEGELKKITQRKQQESMARKEAKQAEQADQVMVAINGGASSANGVAISANVVAISSAPASSAPVSSAPASSAPASSAPASSAPASSATARSAPASSSGAAVPLPTLPQRGLSFPQWL